MATKETTKSVGKVDYSNLVYTDQDKKRRAEDAYLILTGKNPREAQMGQEHRTYLRERFSELMAEDNIDLKDKDAAIYYIYKKMGGAVRTLEQQAKIKKVGNIFKGKAAKEAAPVDENDEDIDSDDDEDDDD